MNDIYPLASDYNLFKRSAVLFEISQSKTTEKKDCFYG